MTAVIMKWVMSMLLPCILIALGIALLAIKPERNSYFGYRTRISLSSDEHWRRANKTMGIALILVNLFAVIPAICLVNLFAGNVIAVVLSDIFAAILGLVAVVIITEITLRTKI